MPSPGTDYPRAAPVRPLLVGDLVAGRRVAGFTWTGPGGVAAAGHLDDRLLFDGDENLPTPPDRTVPQTADGAELKAVVPPADLPNNLVSAAASIDSSLPLRADALLDLRGAPWQQLIRPLLAAVHATGHQAWLAGGAARDLVAGAQLHEVKDLDLAGTVPPGRFTDISYQTLRALGMSEYRTTITPESLVCAVVPPKSKTRLIEYRGLHQGGFRFPAVGSRLAEDARYRDFSFNALLYDTLKHEVFDACGTGLTDLLGETRRFVPQDVSEDPLKQAMIVLRAAKFALRWRDNTPLDLTSLHSWIGTLPPDFCQTLTPAHWNGLRSAYKRTIHDPPQRLQDFAAHLPQAGRELIETLIR
jgi:poly(A) polymerase